MRAVRIAIFDEERDYAEKLSAYLGKRGYGRWQVSAYTSRDLLERDVKGVGLDLVSATDRRLLCKIREENRGMPVLWIKEEDVSQPDGLPSVYRYQSVAAIAEALEETVNTMVTGITSRIPTAAVYSPVGRCGKTTLALQLVRQGRYGRWLYIGMEDYSFLWDGDEAWAKADTFLYHVKERNGGQVFLLIKESGGFIPSGFSPFDTKCLTEEDVQWLLERLQEIEGYAGVVFDFGTGALSELSVLMQFDYIVVPYLCQEKAQKKLAQFRALMEACGFGKMDDRLIYVDMEKEEEQDMALKKIGGGRWEL